MRLAVVGLGKLGLPLSLVFAKAGFEVCGVDISEERIEEIKTFKHVLCSEPRVTEYLRHYGKNFERHTDFEKLGDIPIMFVITQTPSLADGHFDLSYVKKAVEKCHKANEDAVIVVSSNINLGSIDKLKEIHKRICYNPEFIKQGSIIADFENPKFVIIGAYNKEDGEEVAGVWGQVHDRPIYIISPKEAEITKLSLNFTHSLDITYANMIGELCEEFGANSSKILDIIYLDRRKYKSGLGFGGPCFPRDVENFKQTAKENRVWSAHRFAAMLNSLNEYTVKRYVRKIESYKKARIGILGIAYKPNVPYVYDSQPLKIAERLSKTGYEVCVYDPLAEENAKNVLKRSNVRFCSSVNECLEEADVVFIGIPVKEYINVSIDKPVVNPWR